MFGLEHPAVCQTGPSLSPSSLGGSGISTCHLKTWFLPALGNLCSSKPNTVLKCVLFRCLSVCLSAWRPCLVSFLLVYPVMVLYWDMALYSGPQVKLCFQNGGIKSLYHVSPEASSWSTRLSMSREELSWNILSFYPLRRLSVSQGLSQVAIELVPHQITEDCCHCCRFVLFSNPSLSL